MPIAKMVVAGKMQQHYLQTAIGDIMAGGKRLKPGESGVIRNGSKFNMLEVIDGVFWRDVHANKRVGKRIVSFLCRCECGTEIQVEMYSLLNGHTKSCGCLQRKRTGDSVRTHGLSQDKGGTYGTWKSMICRCENPKSTGYPDYGGRGISVCEEWHDPVAFSKWAESSGRKNHLTLDRIDVNGNYCPENCRWADRRQQGRNKRKTLYAEAFGERKSIIDWTEDERCKATYYALRTRILDGWNHEEAIITPARTQASLDEKTVLEIRSDFSKSMIDAEVAKKYGISKTMARYIRTRKVWANI